MITFQDSRLAYVAELVEKNHPNPPQPIVSPIPSEYFAHLVESIGSQQLSVKASDTILGRAKLAVGGTWQPAAVLATPFETLRAAGMSNAKTQYILNLAEFWTTQTIPPENYARLTNDELIKHLTQVKGIGQWTVEMFLIFCLGRPDVFSVGDLGLRNAVTRVYGHSPALTPKELLTLSETWQPNRSYASRILWKSLDLPAEIL